MDFTLTPYIIGLLSSVVAELFKLFPSLQKNDLTKALTAVVVMIGGTLFSIGFNLHAWDWNQFGQVVLWSFINYKLIVQPIASTMGMASQPAPVTPPSTGSEAGQP